MAISWIWNVLMIWLPFSGVYMPSTSIPMPVKKKRASLPYNRQKVGFFVNNPKIKFTIEDAYPIN
jgi:hypothetical protein